VKEYIRKRRLTLAMQELASTKRRIIEIALDLQFESQESFTRAFKTTFGFTPGDCRRRKAVSSLLHQKPRITLEYLNHLYGGIFMKPKFIEFPQTKVVGYGSRFISILSPEKNNMKVIPALWGKLMSEIGAVSRRKGETCFGLVEALPKVEKKNHEDEMFYIAGAEVLDFKEVPAGMIQRTIPAGKYALFTHKGKLDTLEHTMNAIYGSWLAKSDCELRDAPHLELYDRRFIPNSANSEFDNLLPVK
jgi:AraC family transcriptional regulator